MATKAGRLHELDERNDRMLRERQEREGDEQVSLLISFRYLSDILGILMRISGAHFNPGQRGLPGVKAIA
jgi:hypothetical protein